MRGISTIHKVGRVRPVARASRKRAPVAYRCIFIAFLPPTSAWCGLSGVSNTCGVYSQVRQPVFVRNLWRGAALLIALATLSNACAVSSRCLRALLGNPADTAHCTVHGVWSNQILDRDEIGRHIPKAHVIKIGIRRCRANNDQGSEK